MKRTTGRVGIGLVLVTLFVGACLTEPEPEVNASVEVTAPRDIAEQGNVRDPSSVVLALRNQLNRTRASVKTNDPNAFANRSRPGAMHLIGPKADEQVDTFSASGLFGDSSANKARVVLPQQADGSFQLVDERSEMTIEVALIGATTALREDADGFTVYRRGYANDAHVVHRTTLLGTEDYVFFPEQIPAEPTLRYDVALGHGVAGLRMVSRTVEFLDAKGAPRLRMNPPYAIDGTGRRIELDVGIEGCAFDSKTAPPMGRQVVIPGAEHCTIRLTWDSSVKAPLVVDPAWSKTITMLAPRLNAAFVQADVVQNRIFVSGGEDEIDGTVLHSTEFYEAGEQLWSPGPDMVSPRTRHAMAIGPGGVVLAIGGKNVDVLNSYEKYVPGAGATWQGTFELPEARMNHTATTMQNSLMQPVIAMVGGENEMGVPFNTSRFYDGGWSPPQQMARARSGHTATLLSSKKLLVVGGRENAMTVGNTAELCDSSVMAGISCWQNLTTTLKEARTNHVAIKLPDGRVLVAGGDGAMKTAEIFSTSASPAQAWTPTGSLNFGRGFAAIAFLEQSTPPRVVIAGGIGDDGMPMASAEAFDAMTGEWSKMEDMHVARAYHRAAQTTQGRAIFFGGTSAVATEANLLNCGNDKDCKLTEYCSADGVCKIKKPLGEACNVAAGADCWADNCGVCASAGCADGICCNEVCDGQCESCDGSVIGSKIGQCVAVTGEPHPYERFPKRTPCKDHDVCGGVCNGIEREVCTYPNGNSCDSGCADGKFQQYTCDGAGSCSVSFEQPCGAYVCDDKGNQCTTSCTPAGGEVMTDVGCNPVTAVCNMGGQCIPRPTFCQESVPNSGVFDQVVPENGVPVDCEPYLCAAGECLSACNTAYDCQKGYTCSINGKCESAEFDDTVAIATSCSTTPVNESSRFGWLAAIALAGAIAARRNRPRA